MVWDWFFWKKPPIDQKSQGAQQTSDCDLISIGSQQFLPTGDDRSFGRKTRIDFRGNSLKTPGTISMNFRGKTEKNVRGAYQCISYIHLPSGKLTQQWNIIIFDRNYIFKGSIFHCYVRLPERIFNMLRYFSRMHREDHWLKHHLQGCGWDIDSMTCEATTVSPAAPAALVMAPPW